MDSDECVACAPGTFQQEIYPHDEPFCNVCEPGRYTDATGSSECLEEKSSTVGIGAFSPRVPVFSHAVVAALRYVIVGGWQCSESSEQFLSLSAASSSGERRSPSQRW
jgi:hypothetical protein